MRIVIARRSRSRPPSPQRARGGRRSPPRSRAPCSPPTTPGIAASTRCRSRPGRQRPWPRSGRRRRCTPTSARGSGTADRSGSRSRSSARARRRAPSGSSTPTSPTAGRTRSRPGVKIEGGADSDGDRHALIVDRDACRLYELYALRRVGGRWTAGSGAIWNLRSNRVRPAGWTSADAAGLAILPGSRATTRWRRVGSIMPFASPSPARVEPTSGRRGTTRARSPTPRCRRWEHACA